MLSDSCLSHYLVKNNVVTQAETLQSGSMFVYFHEYYKASLNITMVPEQ